MERDLSVFPHDDNGNVLWAAHQHGIKIGDEHVLKYVLIFPQVNDALTFSLFLLRQGYWVQFNELENKPGYAAEVSLKMGLEVTHAQITDAEAWLAEHAGSLGGKNDGWEIQEKIREVVGFGYADLSNR